MPIRRSSPRKPSSSRASSRFLAPALLIALAACPQQDDGIEVTVRYTETREPCAERDPLRQLYFGDLHFHTRHSWDAYGYHLTVTPAESYRFAQGDSVWLPPLDAAGRGTREARLRRPLDFAAATDHAEFLGETALCTTPGSSAYDTEACQAFRKLGSSAVASWGVQLIRAEGNQRQSAICGDEGERCLAAARQVWQQLRQAAEEAYDRSSACSFVSFVGYEYTATPKISNEHRNVIFRNAEVPELPVSYYEQGTRWGLWRELKRVCIDGDPTCDVLVIPHNPNWSNGVMFTPDYPESFASEQEAASLRAMMEPVLEIFQHKGDIECTNGLSGIERVDDPLCDFEKIRRPPLDDCGDGTGIGGVQDLGCISRRDFLRGILLQGLAEEARIGVNPYQLGVIGATDTHNGTPGMTAERGFMGHVGTVDDTPAKRLGEGTLTHNTRVNNPGGLAAVWAVERSRDAIFEALRRRETFSTSGTRIAVRLFGGWSLPEDLCQREPAEARVEAGYRQGVPMGGLLPERSAEAPRFALWARQDPGTAEVPGTPLHSAQIVKAWIDQAGASHERVFQVAGDPSSQAAVDPATCLTSGSGAEQLCAVWTDPQFDADQRAVYYARVVENPTCRWSSWECNGLSAQTRPAVCDDPAMRRPIQERAWTSPIWYRPGR